MATGLGKGAQLPGRRITLWAPNDCGGALKSQQCHTYILQYSTLLPEDLRFENGGAKLASFPGAHLTSLRPYQSGD